MDIYVSIPSGVKFDNSTPAIRNLGLPTEPFDNIYVNNVIGPSGVNIVHAEIPTGDVDGVNNQYRTVGQIINNDAMVAKNGLVLQPVTEYVANTSTITFASPPPINSKLVVGYHWDTATVPLAWDANVIAAWDLHTDYQDSTVYNVPLTVYGNAPTFTTIGGRQAPQYADVTGGMFLMPLSGLNGLSTWTMEWQQYTPDTSYSAGLLSLGDSTTWMRFSQGYPSAGYAAINVMNVFFIYSATMLDNTWQAYALTYNGTTLKMYLNGSLVGSVGVAGWTITVQDPNLSVLMGEWYGLTPKNVSMRNVVISNIVRTTFPTTQV